MKYIVIKLAFPMLLAVVGCSKNDAEPLSPATSLTKAPAAKDVGAKIFEGAKQPANADVLGVRSGMTADEVRPILKARFPNVKIEENNYDSKGNDATPRLAIMVIDSGVKTDDQFEESLFVRFTQTTGKVYYIKREVNRVAPSNSYLQAITEKYGSEFYQVPLKVIMQWNWDKNGKKMLTDVGGFCAAQFDSHTPPTVESSCGVGISAYIVGSQSDQAKGMKVALMDSSVLSEEIAAVSTAKLTDPKAAAQKPAM